MNAPEPENLNDAMSDILTDTTLEEMRELLEVLAAEATFKAEQPDLFAAVSAILSRHTSTDLGGMVATILPRLGDCHCITDFRRVVRQEFARWEVMADENTLDAIAGELAALAYKRQV